MEPLCYISGVSLTCAATDRDIKVTEVKANKCVGLNTFTLNTDISTSGRHRQLKTDMTKARKVGAYE